MNAPSRLFKRAISAAESLTGKRFGLLVASSLVATTAIVATGLSSAGGNGPLAALLGRSLASESTPVSPVPTGQGGPSYSSPGSSGGGTGAFGSPVPAPISSASPPSLAPTGPAKESEVPTPTTPTPTGPVGPIEHVFVISLASPGYEQSFGAESQMPYLATTLLPKGQLVPGYSLLSANTLPNNIAAISGQRPNPLTEANCTTYAAFPLKAKPDKKGHVAGSGCIYPVEALTVADQISSARLRWRAYMEDMVDESGPHNCVQPQPGEPDEPATGGYAARNNPFVYFHSVLDVGDCAINDMPLEQLEKDLRKPETTPEFAFISPNLCRSGAEGQCPEGVPGGAAAADGFLAEWVPKILAAKAIKRDGLLVIAFNGLSSPERAAAEPQGSPADSQKVGALLVSRFVTAGGTREGEFNPYSLLRTIEDLFALTPLAEAGSKKTVSLGADLLGPQY